MLDFQALAERCAPAVHSETMARIVRAESSFNPNALAVTKAPSLQRQPSSRDEAIATAKSLTARGLTYDAGLAQVNSRNFLHYGLTPETVFEPCTNLRVASDILRNCYVRASKLNSDAQHALRDALSCYNSGNFSTGYRQGYVRKVIETESASVHKTPDSIRSLSCYNSGNFSTGYRQGYVRKVIETESASVHKTPDSIRAHPGQEAQTPRGPSSNSASLF